MEQHIQAIVDSIASIKIDIKELREEIAKNYVTNERLKPVESFVATVKGAVVVVIFGLLGLILSHVIPSFGL